MTAEKVREDRLRRVAKRQGLQLVKSRRRDWRADDYGRYFLIGGGCDSEDLSLDDVEPLLLGYPPVKQVGPLDPEGELFTRDDGSNWDNQHSTAWIDALQEGGIRIKGHMHPFVFFHGFYTDESGFKSTNAWVLHYPVGDNGGPDSVVLFDYSAPWPSEADRAVKEATKLCDVRIKREAESGG